LSQKIFNGNTSRDIAFIRQAQLETSGVHSHPVAVSVETFAMTASLIFSASIALIVAQGGAIKADQARAHIGQTATVEGRVSVSKTPAGEAYLDIGGDGASAPFSAYVSRTNSAKFQDVEKLDGKNVQITGQISTFRGKPEIFLTDPTQIAVKADPPAPTSKPQ
jgi:hypothetical protein